MKNPKATCDYENKSRNLGKGIPECIGCNILVFSIVVELGLHGIGMQRCRIGIGILVVFFKRQELVWVFYC